MTQPRANRSAPEHKPLVLFDGACPMCSKEIAHYRRLHAAERVEWLDISAAGAALPDGIDYAAALARFHVRDAAGKWHTGAHGFVELWRHLPGYRHLGLLLRRLRMVGLLDRVYAHWARWRAKKQCSDSLCAPDRRAGSRSRTETPRHQADTP